jgi:hypothetical protein
MRKGPESAYDKWNISVVICDILTNSYCFKMTEFFIPFLILDLINWNLSSPPFFGGVRVARSWLSWSHHYDYFKVLLELVEWICWQRNKTHSGYQVYEEFEDTKEAIRTRKSKKDIQREIIEFFRKSKIRRNIWNI